MTVDRINSTLRHYKRFGTKRCIVSITEYYMAQVTFAHWPETRYLSTSPNTIRIVSHTRDMQPYHPHRLLLSMVVLLVSCPRPG
jgi:hypothetical protein